MAVQVERLNSEPGVQTPEFKVGSSDSGVQSREFRVRGSESGVQSSAFRLPSLDAQPTLETRTDSRAVRIGGHNYPTPSK